MEDVLVIAQGEHDIGILPKMANRHGLIAGATGTGKTVTLRVLAEAFSRIGVPVFLPMSRGTSAASAKPAATTPRCGSGSRPWDGPTSPFKPIR